MILEEEVKMVINQFNIEYYQKILNTKLKCGDRIMVSIKDLPETSGVVITAICEYCGQSFRQQYRRYVTAGLTGKHCCSKCRYQKIVDLSMERYGTKCTLNLPEVHQKMVHNNLLKYGTTHSVTPESYAKRGETMKKRYGCEYSLQSPEIRAKANQTMYELGNCEVFSSKQQEYLCTLLNGISNFPVGHYHIDCFLKEQNIGIEYSGRGHDLSVRLGDLTEKEFQAREKARHTYFLNHNIPIIEFVSHTDKLPPDDEIIRYVNESIEKFSQGLKYIQIIFPN